MSRTALSGEVLTNLLPTTANVASVITPAMVMPTILPAVIVEAAAVVVVVVVVVMVVVVVTALKR